MGTIDIPLGVTLPWTSISSRGNSNTLSCFILQKPGWAPAVWASLARVRLYYLLSRQTVCIPDNCKCSVIFLSENLINPTTLSMPQPSETSTPGFLRFQNSVTVNGTGNHDQSNIIVSLVPVSKWSLMQVRPSFENLLYLDAKQNRVHKTCYRFWPRFKWENERLWCLWKRGLLENFRVLLETVVFWTLKIQVNKNGNDSNNKFLSCKCEPSYALELKI